MDLLVSAYYDPKNIAGRPDEFDPFVTVWTTDPEQAHTVRRGRAVDILELNPKTGYSLSHTTFSASKGSLFPINDIKENLCVSLYTYTESDGTTPDAGKSRPYVLDVGQINIPWHVIVCKLLENGQSVLTEKERGKGSSALDDSSAFFPKTKVKQPVTSMVTYDGVEYEIQAQMATNRRLAMELREIGPEKLSRRGDIVLHITMHFKDEGKLKPMPLSERLDWIEYHYLKACPKFKDATFTPGHTRPGDIVEASKLFGRMTHHMDELYRKAMGRYRKVYDSIFLASDMTRYLVVHSSDRQRTIKLRPDVPQMVRFHLPTWTICNEPVPYAEWILQSVPENAKHMPQPTEATEYFLSTLANMAFKRVDINPVEFVTTIDNLTIDVSNLNERDLKKYLKVGSKKRNTLIKAHEMICYTLMMIAHVTRYQGDGRLIRLFKRMVRVDVDAPQHEMVSGVRDDGDCEDSESPEVIIFSLVRHGRINGDLFGGGRGWKDPILAAMRRFLYMTIDFTIFGSVSGRQVSDSKSKQGMDDEEGFLFTPEDISDVPGGHTFMILQALMVATKRYKKYGYFVDPIVGYSVSDRLHEHGTRVLQGYTQAKYPERSLDTEKLHMMFDIYRSIPTAILEGTGRQAPLQWTLDSYVGLDDEFLRRIAQRASEIDLLKRWPTIEKREANVDSNQRVVSLRTQQLSNAHHHRHHSTHWEEDNDKTDASEEEGTPRNIAVSDAERIASMGDAAPYMFQRRLTVQSMCKKGENGALLQRHISAFYRRGTHSVSVALNRIMPNEFVHLMWVSPDRGTYGAPVRFMVEDSGDAIAIPLSLDLHKAYLEHTEDVEPGDAPTLMVDIVARKMRQITPYDFSFQHLMLPASAGSVKSSEPLLSADAVTNIKDFFLHSEFSFTQSAETVAHSNNDFGIVTITPKGSGGSITLEPLVIMVAPDSAVLEAIRNIKKKKQDDEEDRDSNAVLMRDGYLVRNVLGCMVVRPPDGRITERSIKLLSEHILAGKGIRDLVIYSERILPWLSDNLCASFRRDVLFKLDANMAFSNNAITGNVRSRKQIKSEEQREKSDILDELMAAQKTSVLEIMAHLRVDIHVIAPERLKVGMLVELEHGTLLGYPQTNVTKDDLHKTASIALAHFVENPGSTDVTTGQRTIPDYYDMLEEMEDRADRLWDSTKSIKPSVFLREGPPMTSSLDLSPDLRLHYTD